MARKLRNLRQRRRWQHWVGLPFLLCLLMLGASAAPAYASGSATNAQVTVNLGQTLSAVSPLAIGVNAAVWDGHLQDTQKVGATPIITVNYGTGTPEEAAAWVKYANVTKHYHIHYWDIGNELYGNGTYGALWESDKHALGPASYANNTLQFIQA